MENQHRGRISTRFRRGRGRAGYRYRCSRLESTHSPISSPLSREHSLHQTQSRRWDETPPSPNPAMKGSRSTSSIRTTPTISSSGGECESTSSSTSRSSSPGNPVSTPAAAGRCPVSAPAAAGRGDETRCTSHPASFSSSRSNSQTGSIISISSPSSGNWVNMLTIAANENKIKNNIKNQHKNSSLKLFEFFRLCFFLQWKLFFSDLIYQD